MKWLIRRLRKFLTHYKMKSQKFRNIALQIEKNFGNIKSDLAPQTVPIPHDVRTPNTENVLRTCSRTVSTPLWSDVPRSSSSVSLLQLQSFQTQPGSSCCDHICRPDLEEDPDYDFCCRHRCRKPWT